MKKLMVRGIVAAGALVVAHAALAADVYLLKSDDANNSSFIKNPTTAGYGWSDGKDPNGDTDYLVPTSTAIWPVQQANSILWFPGRSMTLIYGRVNCYGTGSATSGIGFSNLLIKVGTICGSIYNVNGKITVDASDYGYPKKYTDHWDQKGQGAGPGFRSVMSQSGTSYTGAGAAVMHLNATMVAAQPNNVASGSGCDPLSWHNDSKRHVMNRAYQYYHFAFDGDCSQYFATNYVEAKTMVTVNTPDFGGSFYLKNYSELTSGPSNALVRIRGGVVSRDGFLEIPSGKTLDVGDLDFAFAATNTYVAKDGTNTYTETMWDGQPYTANRASVSQQIRNWLHSRSWVHPRHRNVIALGWSLYVNTALFPTTGKATLKARKAVLHDTLITSDYKGSLFQAGDLTLDGVTLDYLGFSGNTTTETYAFTIAVTNSLTIGRKVKIVPPLLNSNLPHRTEIIKLAAGATGTLDLDDFDLQLPTGTDPYRYGLTIETKADGAQILYFEDRAKTGLSTKDGYVTLGQSESGSNPKRSLYGAGYWSDALAPHAYTNYFQGGNTLCADQNEDYTFPGRLLTGMFLRFNNQTHGKLTIPKWRIICENATYKASIYGSGSAGNVYRPTLAGDLLIVTRATGTPLCIGSLYSAQDNGENDCFTFLNTLHAWTNITVQIAFNGYGDETGARFLGDNSDFNGIFQVLRKSRLALGGGAMPGTVELQAATSGLTIEGADGATATVGKLVSTNTGATDDDNVRVTVSKTNALEVADLVLNGKLVKLGDGALGIDNVTTNALGEEAASVEVKAGSVYGAALANVAVNFATGAGFAFDLDDEDMPAVAITDNMTFGDTVALSFYGAADSYNRKTYTLFSGTKAQLEVLLPKLVKVNHTTGKLPHARYAIEGTDDDAVLKVTFKERGLLIMIKSKK